MLGSKKTNLIQMMELEKPKISSIAIQVEEKEAGDNGAGEKKSGDNGAGDNGAGEKKSGDNGAGDNGAGEKKSGENDAKKGIGKKKGGLKNIISLQLVYIHFNYCIIIITLNLIILNFLGLYLNNANISRPENPSCTFFMDHYPIM